MLSTVLYIHIMNCSHFHLPSILIPLPLGKFFLTSPPPTLVSSFCVWPTELNRNSLPIVAGRLFTAARATSQWLFHWRKPHCLL